MPKFIERRLDLSEKQLLALQIELDEKRKHPGFAWLLFIFGWPAAAHRWYLGMPWWSNLLWMFTLGYLTIGAWIDLFTLHDKVAEINRSIEDHIIDDILETDPQVRRAWR